MSCSLRHQLSLWALGLHFINQGFAEQYDDTVSQLAQRINSPYPEMVNPGDLAVPPLDDAIRKAASVVLDRSIAGS